MFKTPRPGLRGMRLKHLNLAVPDVAEARAFFQKLLGFERLEDKGGVLSVLKDEDGFILIVSNFGRTAVLPEYLREFHLGFSLASPAEVDEMDARLQGAGSLPEQGPARIRGGYTFSFRAFGCVLLEFTSYGGA
ncbi:VOC family protein [Deinococcus metallilatus]|uniref:Catechol 2,3-dioxygenase-like lactoylglutathione lyase family enzyme n=1 Tax=Deinococcus metallilatus TaxID=1211322 RepID=A0AAJ5F4E9_9DEIO|nr:VOC family protein [Deinococcus metallilatus]MBB5294388.1 catechol 2,3-dioxygenase-like lactoylglutathione lyase family enzyme [Deinococcus metallilatus]QBY10143.1 VOC family protein [Deinococcus metallilatus]RXJ13869.1 VOC family protein [Deinococcus metallilatus]TLK29835.1 VOC family protein [Deinococcus metallilatus]